MKMNTFKHLSQISQQAQLGTVAYWSVCEVAAMNNSDRTPEGFISRVREGWDG